ncbi:ABC transporter permease [Paenibacillus lemnae]|uniref:DUF2705 family protein n=1 Tax=Paenibacillus lemnae TaxID=1330551 RepID=A0A848M8M9_PAELE|nr:DUF2705 family protein [Paenibacillus lemnae]NMO97568.1 DUF2705 family protein [Paenibacillus lemnae]
MRSFGKLMINEWLKMTKKKSFLLPFGLLAVMVFLVAYMIKTFSPMSMNVIEYAQLSVASQGMGQILTLLAIVVTAGSVAKEHSYGTIKLLLIRSQSRVVILASKYAVILLYVALLTAFTFAAGSAAGALFMGSEAGSVSWGDAAMTGVYSLIYTMIYVTFTFTVGIVTRSTGPAIGIGMFMVVVQNLANQLLINYSWYKYLPFVNVDLSIYSGGGASPMPGMNMSFSASVLAVYLLLFLIIGFWTFKRRDVS